MHTTIEETPVTQKIRDLCQAILDQPNMPEIRRRVDAFMGDEKARKQYDDLMAKGQSLQEKQQHSKLTESEIKAFEKEREALYSNPIARAFFDAQEELQEVQQTIQQYIHKTIELGRIPTEDDLNGGGCGHGCGCHH